jgi:carboxymethylenebutenolidase
MTRATVEIQTRDGKCPTSVFRPQGSGPWPGVIVYMDAFGPRPALFELCGRLASHGYFVLLPDLFYRMGPYETPPRNLFSDREKARAFLATFFPSASIEKTVSDTAAFLDFLSAQKDVLQPKVGTTGYCMGGARSLAAAGSYPDRIAAAASYHGGGLATDAPDSPHRFAPRMKARVYVAGAVEDVFFPDDMKQRLDDALTAAGVPHTVETYEGARHGWVPGDTLEHNPAAAERHWRTLLELFDSTLKQTA